MKRDPYSVLGVSRNATQDDIKKAFKVKARELHPDKNQDNPEATGKFQEVQEAFEILRDKKKRANYDRFGNMEGGGVTGPEDFFKEFFNSFNSPATGGGRADAGGNFFFRAQSVMTYEVSCTLPELYTGTTKTMKLRRTSKTMDRPSETVIELQIPAGYDGGTKFVFKNMGNEIGQTGVAQDIQFVIKEVPYPGFARKGPHLLTKVQIPLLDALCGGSLEIDVLGVKKVEVKLDGSVTIRPGHKLVVPGEGMPSPLLGRPNGDLIVEFDVLFPQRLTQEQRDKLKEALSESSSRNSRL